MGQLTCQYRLLRNVKFENFLIFGSFIIYWGFLVVRRKIGFCRIVYMVNFFVEYTENNGLKSSSLNINIIKI